jgi:glycosyltransferase 2 family protein
MMAKKIQWRSHALRLIGVGLLVFLFSRVDGTQLAAVLSQMDWRWMLLAFVLYVPHLGIKAYRWRYLLARQGIDYPYPLAFTAYLGAVFIGLFTPGRLGEFIKAAHIARDRGVRAGEAFSSVLIDRLFDLFILLALGLVAILNFGAVELAWVLALLLLLLPVGLVLFSHPPFFGWLQARTRFLGRFHGRFFGADGWLTQMHLAYRQIGVGAVYQALLWTVLAYGLFFLQCYLAAYALGLPITYWISSFAIALGSLVALLPISISGLGTRDAAIVAYLSGSGVALEQGLSFSLSIFFIFYVAGGLFGGVCWLIRPVSLIIHQ